MCWDECGVGRDNLPNEWCGEGVGGRVGYVWIDRAGQGKGSVLEFGVVRIFWKACLGITWVYKIT